MRIVLLAKILMLSVRARVSAIRARADPIGEARRQGVTIGSDCRLISVTFGSEPYLVTLGDHVSATAVQFITHDGGIWVGRSQAPELDVVAPISVGNNVFLGYGVIILPGVTIGDDVVVGAGSVVAKDISPGSVAAGTPARVLRTTEEYLRRANARSVPTKNLNAREKRAYLTDHFHAR